MLEIYLKGRKVPLGGKKGGWERLGGIRGEWGEEGEIFVNQGKWFYNLIRVIYFYLRMHNKIENEISNKVQVPKGKGSFISKLIEILKVPPSPILALPRCHPLDRRWHQNQGFRHLQNGKINHPRILQAQ